MSNNPDLDDLVQSQSRALAPAAVGSQVALMSIISVVTVLVFNVLRPKNKVIYEPKVKYHVGDKPPPRISDSLLGWLPPLVRTKEPELIEKVGLDAVTFLRFTRLMRWLFTGITVLTCGILLPVNAVYNLKHVDAKRRDILSMLTIRNVQGNWLFVHVAVTYLITILIIAAVYMHWRKMVQLRKQWFRSPEYMQSLYARTLVVMGIPKKLQSDEGIRAIFESVKVPYPTTSVHIGRRVGRLPELIEYHNNTVRELEQVLVKYLKGGRVGKKRPTIRLNSCCGCGGQKKDAIDFYTEKLRRTEGAIDEYRREVDSRKAENYGFASMAAVPYAHIVARILENKHPKGTDITLAPNPKDIIWENMNKSSGELRGKRTIGFLWLCLVCFFNTLPLFIISVLANLEQIKTYVGFLERWSDSSPSSFAIVSGVLPPTVSGIFGFFLPIIMRWLSQFMGALTHSKLDRQVIARYFAFLVISQLIIFTLIGVIFNSVEQIVQSVGKKSFKEIIDSLGTLPDTINRTYIDQSSYWLTFFPLRGFLVVFDLAQIVNLVWITFKSHMWGRTPRDIREYTQPPEFQYAIYYSNLLFMGAVGLVFAPLAPLVALAAAIVFWMSSWVYKYQLMFVFITKVETGGRLWNVVINRLMFTVVLMQALMVLTIGLQYGFKSLTWLCTIPPIFMMAGFKFYINKTFHPEFHYYKPTEEELRLAKVHSERGDVKGNRLEKRFGHPALHAELFTPMLHAKMMPLLSQVYGGKIGSQETKLQEYGGQKMDAQIVEGGVKIAAISQNDLEYDPALYRRDRGELDWDARSMASTAMFSDTASVMGPGGGFYAGSTPNLPGYDRYLASGPGLNSPGEQFELTRMDSANEPLLSPRAQYFQSQAAASSNSLSQPPIMHRDMTTDGLSREAPLHRPHEQYTYGDMGAYRTGSPFEARTTTPFIDTRSNSPLPGPPRYPPQPTRQYSTDQQSTYSYHTSPQTYSENHSREPSNLSGNMAGRGAHRT
ncbi:DUF221-domain-containing protein [Dendrothele bispora CBS 962.96]|uniref:DUF221-domain-containing protein n=1 Tax=Dendrothele bispora (strain CBS 962.96) TaxID=1314807 RepID=A0A4S8MQH2_DENBC|nr:DUF221-domain-containing protein [Dendrothele bispora CBS 962.96]